MYTTKLKQRCKVAFVMPHLDAGGVERVVLNILTHLDRSRFAPALILFNRRGALLERVPQDVEIHDLSGGKARWLPVRLARTFAALDTEVAYGGTNAANLTSLVAAYLMRHPPAIIASEHTPPAPYLSDAKMRRLRLPLMRWLYPRAAAVAVPVGRLGDDLRDVLRRPSLRVVALANPVLDSLPQPSPPPTHKAAPDQGAAFLTAGRLSQEKGFDVLISAFARLLPEFPEARLTICGEGPERASLEALCRTLGVAGHVEMPGFVQDPIGRLGAGRIFVLSSRREGFPNVLIEALAAGMPIVAADCPVGPRLALEHGLYGLLVAPQDPAALAEGMRQLVVDHTVADTYRRLGPLRAAPFTVEAAASGFADLFETVAERRGASPVNRIGAPA